MIRSYTTMRKGSKDSAGILGGGHHSQQRRAQTFVEDVVADGNELCDFAFDLHVVGNPEGGKSELISSFVSTNGPDRIKEPSDRDNLDDDTQTTTVHVPHRGVNIRLKIHDSMSSPRDPKMLQYYTYNASGVFIVYSSNDVTTRMEAEEVWWPLYKPVCESGKPVFLIETMPGLMTGIMMPTSTTFSSKKFAKGKGKHKPEFRTAPAGKSALVREIFLDAIDKMIKATDPKAFDKLEMGAPIKGPSRSATIGGISRSMTGTPILGHGAFPPPLPPPSLPPPSTPVPPLPPIPANSHSHAHNNTYHGHPTSINIPPHPPRTASPRPQTMDSPTEVGADSESDSDWEKDIVKGLREVCDRKIEQGDYPGAEKSIQRYLKRCTSDKEKETYQILLAEAQARQGKLNSAEKLLLVLLNDDVTSNAVKIPDAGHLLAECYLANNELDKAEEVIRYVMKARRKVLGKKDKLTVESVAVLLEILTKRGDEEEAEVLQTFLPKGFKRTIKAVGKTTETMAIDSFPRPGTGTPSRKGTYMENEAATPIDSRSPVEHAAASTLLFPSITRTETEPILDDSDGFWKGRFQSLGGSMSRPQSPLSGGASGPTKFQPPLPAFYPDLHIAAAQGDVARVGDLLQKKRLFINSRSYPSMQTPLHVLSECEDKAAAVNVFEFMRRCEQTLDVNAADAAGDTPLHLAFRWKRLSLARKMIASWAHLGAANSVGNTPVHEAIYAGDEMMEMLLTLPTSLREVTTGYLILANKQGKTPLYIAVEQNRSASMIGLLLKAGTPVNLTSAESVCWTPLHIAATMKRADCVSLLLENGAAVDVLGKGASKYHTPLTLAIKKGLEEVVKLLLDNGASPKAVIINRSEGPIIGAEPLYEALSAGHEGIVKLLLSQQPSRQWKTDEIKTHMPAGEELAKKLWAVLESHGIKQGQ